jgi:hypothetical protein
LRASVFRQVTRGKTAPRARTADPYRDLDVVDTRAPRTNQATIGVLSLLAVLTGWWPILGLLALQLAVGLRFGRRWCLPCVVYFELIQPRFGEGPLEDSRPPRFANQVGLAVLGSATLAYVVGAPPVGAVLGLLVAALALLAALTGICAGCEIYRLGARLRGVRFRRVDRIEPADLGLSAFRGPTAVVFSHPLCTDCRSLVAALERSGEAPVTVDVRARPHLARKYGVALVPTLAHVTSDGSVTRWTAGAAN